MADAFISSGSGEQLSAEDAASVDDAIDEFFGAASGSSSESSEAADVPQEQLAPTMPIEEYLVIAPEDRVTSNYWTKAELSNVISTRAAQIARDNNPFVDTSGLTTATEIARREIDMKMCPLIVQRHIGTPKIMPGQVTKKCIYIEEWSANELKF